MSTHWTAGLVAAGACIDAVDWAQAYETFDAAWTACQRGDYMLWWLGKTVRTDADHRAMVRIACQCARLALPHVAAGNKRPLCAIETAERWANGEPDVSLNDVRLAAAAAAHAAYAVYAVAAAAASADAVASAAASADAADAARFATLATCADLVRVVYQTPPYFDTAVSGFLNGGPE